MTDDLHGLKPFLDAAARHAIRPPEETLFSISDRGHLENPTTDLLCYFMQPRGQHGFGTSFLNAFFAQVKSFTGSLVSDDISVSSQVPTKDGKFIDLLACGKDWVLLIENKVYAELDNPLASYMAHARLYQGRTPYFVIFSPDGKGAAGWNAVRYADYCDALETFLPPLPTNSFPSKWIVFANEFILHLRNLSSRIMFLTPDQIAFVEDNLANVESVRMLASQYTGFLLRCLEQRLHKSLPKYTFYAWDAGFALKCKSKEDYVWEFDLQTPIHNTEKGGFGFMIWHRYLSPDDEGRAQSIVGTYERTPYGAQWVGWNTSGGFKSREEAIDALCRDIERLQEIWC